MNLSDAELSTSLCDAIEQSDAPIFQSGPMRIIDTLISRVAKVDFDVLILGETGSGKDVVAQEIHRRSDRASHSFVLLPISSMCDTLIDSELFGHMKGAFSGAHDTKPGKFEIAEGGTIYIPEISELSLGLQLKLLHFMQYRSLVRVGEDPRHGERKCNVRLMLASNVNLEHQVECGRLRADFYYRIAGLRIVVPPLRERGEAIPRLVKHILLKSENTGPERHTFSNEAIAWLAKQFWPGNVRQLENLVRELIVTADSLIITREEAERCYRAERYDSTTFTNEKAPLLCEDSPIEINSENLPSLAEFTDSMQKHYLTALMRRSHGRIGTAAKIGGLTSRGLRKALKRLGIDPNCCNKNGQGGIDAGGGTIVP